MSLEIKSVLVVDGVGADCMEILKAHGLNVTVIPKISKEELKKEIAVSVKLSLYLFYIRCGCRRITNHIISVLHVKVKRVNKTCLINLLHRYRNKKSSDRHKGD